MLIGIRLPKRRLSDGYNFDFITCVNGCIFLMLFAAVALVQDRRLFKSAPKDIQAAVLEHKEPFRGARVIGWILLIIAVLTLPAVCGQVLDYAIPAESL